MRKNLIGGWMAMVAAGLALFAAKPERLRETRPEPRRAGHTPLQEAAGAVEPASFAATAWLWSAAADRQCRIPALWSDAPVSARLGGLLKVSVRDAQRLPAVAARAAAWVSREALEHATAHDADLASKLIAFDRDRAAVVRVLRSPIVGARRARLGAEPLAA